MSSIKQGLIRSMENNRCILLTSQHLFERGMPVAWHHSYNHNLIITITTNQSSKHPAQKPFSLPFNDEVTVQGQLAHPLWPCVARFESYKHWSQVRFTGQQPWGFISILPILVGSGSGPMTNQVSADPHPVVGALPTPPSSLGPPRGLAHVLVRMLKVDGTHMSRMDTYWYFLLHLIFHVFRWEEKQTCTSFFYSLQILSPQATTELNPAEHLC